MSSRSVVCAKASSDIEAGRLGHTAFRWLLAVAAMVALGSVALAGPPKKRAPVYPVTESMRIDPELRILVAPPGVTVRSYKVGRAERQVDLPAAAIARWIRQVGVDALRARGFSPNGEDPQVGGALADLEGVSEDLVRRAVSTEEGAAALLEVCEGRQETAILAQHLRIKAAPHRTYDPFTGQSTLDMSNSSLRGVLFDCQNHERLWEGEMYIRMLPRVGDSGFEAAVVGIFANLEKEED